MRNLLRKYLQLNYTVRAIIDAFFKSLAIYITALLSSQIPRVFLLKDTPLIIIHAILVIIIIVILVFISISFRGAVIIVEEEENRKKQAFAYAHTWTDKTINECIGHFEEEFIGIKKHYIPHEPFKSILKFLEALYETLEAHYSNSENLINRIEFEVTFMTKSYKDDKITIAAWANRDGRKPTSLTLRNGNSEIYNTTIVAELYRSTRATPKIIEDTFSTQYDYHELYDRQRDRIKSSFVYPVLSKSNQLLGCLVLHCDRKNFFKQTDLKFWCELAEIFAKRIALEKLRLDQIINIKLDQNNKKCIEDDFEKPF